MSDATVLGAVAVREIGVDAAAALRDGARGSVAAMFTRSFYATIGGRWICIGPGGLGSGPLNALCALPDAPGANARGVNVGTEVSVSAGMLHLGGALIFSLTGARIWRPDEPPVWSLESLRRGLQMLDRSAGSAIPEDGLGLFVRPYAAPRALLARRAAPILNRFQRRLCELLASGDTPEQDWPGPAVDLLGLGPGLTPSGDDFLAGVMIALTALGRGDLSDLLWAGLEPVARVRTVDVSRAHLDAAARGMGSPGLHECLGAVLAGRDAALMGALSKVDSIGHCSGWDALAGAVAVLRAWSVTAAGSGRLCKRHARLRIWSNPHPLPGGLTKKLNSSYVPPSEFPFRPLPEEQRRVGSDSTDRFPFGRCRCVAMRERFRDTSWLSEHDA